MTDDAFKPKPGLVRVSEIRPSPENDALYRPTDPDDPEIRALAASIREEGVLEPLVVTADGWILSGHRRHAAATLAGVEVVPVRRLEVSWATDRATCARLLREFNRQRPKSIDEVLREQLVDAARGPGVDPMGKLRAHREEKAKRDRGEALPMRAYSARAKITGKAQPFLAAVLAVLEEQAEFLPLSIRAIHYRLLSAPPLKNASKPGSRYANDLKSYKALSALTTRARLAGLMPMEAVEDETREVVTWAVHPSPGPFIAQELRGFLRGYRRDLQRPQPVHIELVVEKLTCRSIVESVAAEFHVPLTVGRGYCSLPPRAGIAERFRKSGKEKLVLLIVSDADADGEGIAESFARSMRDDFNLGDAVHPVKVALTPAQAKAMKLPGAMKVKTKSSRAAAFMAEHGTIAWELESLQPRALQKLVRDAIVAELDIDLWNREQELQQADAVVLEATRERITRFLRTDAAGGSVA